MVFAASLNCQPKYQVCVLLCLPFFPLTLWTLATYVVMYHSRLVAFGVSTPAPLPVPETYAKTETSSCCLWCRVASFVFKLMWSCPRDATARVGIILHLSMDPKSQHVAFCPGKRRKQALMLACAAFGAGLASSGSGDRDVLWHPGALNPQLYTPFPNRSTIDPLIPEIQGG